MNCAQLTRINAYHYQQPLPTAPKSAASVVTNLLAGRLLQSGAISLRPYAKYPISSANWLGVTQHGL